MTGILSKFELDFLRGEIQLDKRAVRNARYRIKSKINGLSQLLPLLTEKGILADEHHSSQAKVSLNEDANNLIK
jgi:hypothetical protein